MRKSAWLLSMLVAVLLGVSMLAATPVSVNAIGEVTPTPALEDTEDNNEEEQEEVDVEELINEALEQLNDGEFRGAVATMDVAIDADPTNVFAYTIRGVANAQLGQFDDSIADFTTAIELEPWQFDLYLFRGDAYIADGSLTDALLDYDQAIYISPLNAEAYGRRSSVYYDLDDETAGDVDDLLARGISALNFGDADQAIGFFEEAADAADDLPVAGQAYYLIGITNQINGDTDEAFDAYAEALDIDDQIHNAY
ncbi:MAG: tetratricopeptide repeat protein, partial [Chloroflexota bacterium]